MKAAAGAKPVRKRAEKPILVDGETVEAVITVDDVFYVSIQQSFPNGVPEEPLLTVMYPSMPDDYEDIGEVDWSTIAYEGELWGWQPA